MITLEQEKIAEEIRETSPTGCGFVGVITIGEFEKQVYFSIDPENVDIPAIFKRVGRMLEGGYNEQR